MFSGATFNFVFVPIVTSLHATETQERLLRELPGIGGLLAIFVAGALVMKFGGQRCLKWAGLLMVIGYLITCVAPSTAMVIAGLLAAYVGKAAVLVIVVSVLGSSIRGKGARATAFATWAMLGPGVSVALPIVAAAVVEAFGWRWVAVIWLIGGVLVIISAYTLIPADRGAGSQRQELWTPVLAGVVLVGLVQVASLATEAGILSTPVVVALGVTVVTLIVLILLMRRLPNPSMSVSAIRGGGAAMVILVVLLVPFANMLFYGTLGAQYIYGLSALAVSIFFIPIQLAGVAGARLAGRLVKARGITFAGTATILATAVVCFLSVAQTTTTPIIVPLLVLMVYSACASGTIGTLTNSIMSSAAKGKESDASAYRSAAMAMGSSLGAVFLSTIVVSIMAASISNQSSTAGLDPAQSAQIANDLREGATSGDAASQYSVPLTNVDEVELFMQQAYLGGFWAQGVASGTVLLVAAGMFYVGRRKMDRREALQEQDASADV